MYQCTCIEAACCVSKETIHIQQTVVTVHHHLQHTLGQAGQGRDVIRQFLNIIINQLEGGLCSTLTVQGISDPCHERVTGASSCPAHTDNTRLHCGRTTEHRYRAGTPCKSTKSIIASSDMHTSQQIATLSCITVIESFLYFGWS